MRAKSSYITQPKLKTSTWKEGGGGFRDYKFRIKNVHLEGERGGV